MQIPRPAAVGDPDVVKQLRSVLFSEPILGAASVRPKGYLALLIAPLFGWWAHMLAQRATGPLPPTILYLAVTPVDIRLFSKPRFSPLFEIGRWKKGSYRASLDGSKLDLEVERLGRIRLHTGREARPVIDLVMQGAGGPAV